MHFESYEEFRDWLKANPQPKEVDEDDWYIPKTKNYLEQLQQRQTKKDKLLNTKHTNNNSSNLN